MSLDLERMRFLVRKGLGNLDEADLADAEVDELLNISLWQLEDKYPFHARKTNRPTSLVIDQYLYDLSPLLRLDAIESVAVTTALGERTKLARTNRDWWDANFDENEKDTPTRYFRENNCLYVYPIPNAVLPLELNYRQGVESLVESTNEETGLPRNWDEIVVAGAIWRGHYFKGDYDQARQATNFQLSLMRSAVPVEAKEERDSRYAGLNVLHDWPVDGEE